MRSEGKKPVFSDLMGRKFTAEQQNRVYVGGITYLSIADGSNMYLITVIAGHSRQLADFATADHMHACVPRSLEGAGGWPSMGVIGTTADNFSAESFNAALKCEVLQDTKTSASQLFCRRDVLKLLYPLQHDPQAFLVGISRCGV